MLPEVITFKVNGETHDLLVKPGWTLMFLLRERLGLIGVKQGCTTGNCGSCKVLVNGQAVVSCTTNPKSVVGKEIVTIEGLSGNGKLDSLQESFVRHNALQCGFCIPGMIIASKALLNRNPHPDEKQIGLALRGNICRCGCYVEIREAIVEIARSGGVPK